MWRLDNRVNSLFKSIQIKTDKVRVGSRRLFSSLKGDQTLSTMAPDTQSGGSVKQGLAKIFQVSIRASVPHEPNEKPRIIACNKPIFGDYQCNNAMTLWEKLEKKGSLFTGPQPVGRAIINNLPTSEMIESCTVTERGFMNIKLSREWMAESIHKMLTNGIGIWAPKLAVNKVVVDFSSPNIAKEMHVGHLRSTIIGDTLARMLEFSNVEVLRMNHVGDWGTQFGMLIEYLLEKFPSLEVASDQAIGDLEAFYKASSQRFNNDPEFKKRAQLAVVSLQGGEEKYRKAWEKICDISRKNFQRVYERLGIELEEKGESFYNPYIPSILEKLDKKGLIEESKGARVIKKDKKGLIEESEGAHVIKKDKKEEENPLIVVKKDGGFGYATTDLAALWYRLNEEKADWIIYVVDVGQKEHFEMVFNAAKRAGWVAANDSLYPKATHLAFGFVLGEDGKKFRTRSTEVVRLVDLLDEAKSRCQAALVERGKGDEWTKEELAQTAEAVGYGAVKYADLKNNKSTNYKFNFDQMLNDKGNTAVYLLYAHARICSIIRKSGKDMEELKKTGRIVLSHNTERMLGLHLLQFAENVEKACTDLSPNVLCEYVYNLSEHFTRFYSECKVVDSEQETSRLLLCEATAVVMRKCFHLLGIVPVYKI